MRGRISPPFRDQNFAQSSVVMHGSYAHPQRLFGAVELCNATNPSRKFLAWDRAAFYRLLP